MARSREKQIERLAAAIVADNRRQLEGKSLDWRLGHTYYILNISQRAVYGMYCQMKAAKAMHPADAPGDMDRLRWELGLLSDEMARYYPETREDDAT